MSGIVGLYNLDGRPVEQPDIQQMVDSIAHRGPDGSDIWTNGFVGLGHRMLWTTPESLHEKLPLMNKAGNLTITADARIDNRDELIPTLNFNGRPRETIPDSEIILAAYEKWGEKCPTHLLGDFSFAIHDKRKQIIYCARDPIGIKPFYYYFKGGKFRWSSEPKAIFEDKTISKEPNLPLICLYLLNRFDEREETLYKDVYRLPPSHFMVLENGQIRKGQYWDIDPNYSIRYKTDQEYAERFLELFKEAIRARLRSHGPVGALLSGGLDSSSIVCTAQKLYQEKSILKNEFETFSVIFDQLPCDERFYIGEVVRKWNIKANYFPYEEYFPSIVSGQNEKYFDLGFFPTLISHDQPFGVAQQKGTKVMLHGIGGDDFLAVGFDHLTDLMLQGNFYKMIMQLRQDSILFSHSPYRLFLYYCIKPMIPRSVKLFLRRVLKPFRWNKIPSYINTAYTKKAGVDERLRTPKSPKKFPTHSQQRLYEVFLHGTNRNIALDLLERFSSHFGIESRYPFFERRLVEFLLALPEDQRWRGEWPKAILRKAMDGILPETIRVRKDKADFSCMIDLEFKDRLAPKIEKLIETSAFTGFEIINFDKLQQLFDDYRQGKTIEDARDAIEIFVWLESWYRSMSRI
jgi:asparagine synthase (glutamine-hydrolysing)